MRHSIERDGFVIVPQVVTPANVVALIDEIDAADFFRAKRGEEIFGARNILEHPAISALAREPALVALVVECIGTNVRAVRGIFFDKTPGANWPVAWHQDLTLAVTDRHEVAGWGNWSVKAGIHHVQPPADVLERMVTLRVHLDDCGADNGPVRVLPGSHRMGRIAGSDIVKLRAKIAEVACCAEAGSVLVMKPLLLHASSAATAPRHRRVIHIEYAPDDLLPPELNWLPVYRGRSTPH